MKRDNVEQNLRVICFAEVERPTNGRENNELKVVMKKSFFCNEGKSF